MTTQIHLNGPIGFKDWWDENGVVLSDITSILAASEGDVVVHINSFGGVATEGCAIYNAFKAYSGGTVTMVIEGVAASAASLIAMAGNTIRFAEGALMMIHDPSAITIGPAADHRKAADELDMMADEYAGIYARRSGMSVEDVRDLMRDETWMTGTVAKKFGFANEIGGEAVKAMAFAWSAFRNAPPSLTAENDNRHWSMTAMAAGRKEITMTVPNTAPSAPPVAPVLAATTALTPPATAIDMNAVRAEATAAERSRIAEINRIVMTAKLPSTLADTLIGEGISLDAARARVIDAMASAAPAAEQSQIHVTADATDRWREGASKALLAKCRLEGGERNEFSSLNMREMARSSLDMRGIKMQFRNGLDMVAAAFVPTMAGGMHTTSDFGFVLQNVASKSMLKGWEEAPETFPLWTAKGQASDFRKTLRVGVNLFPNLEKIEEGAEYHYGTIGDRGEEVLLATYGKLFAISRQAIINDDMSVFSSMPRAMGRASRRTIGNLVYGVLTSNPVMSDGVALFHATHKNLLAAQAPSTASFDAARTAMGQQVDPDGIASALNIRPKYVIVPLALEGASKLVLESETQVSTGQANPKLPNIVRNMATVISEGRLDANSATAWYMAADPNVHDTIEVTYLDGIEEPYLEQRQGWSIDGTEFKVRIDAGVKPLDFRGLSKNAGA